MGMDTVRTECSLVTGSTQAGRPPWALDTEPDTEPDTPPWAPDMARGIQVPHPDTPAWPDMAPDTAPAPSALDNIEHKLPFRPKQAAVQSLIAMLPVSLYCLLKPILTFCVVLSLHSY